VTPPRPLPLESYGPRDGTEARRAEILFGDEFERKAVELAREQSIPELVAVSLTERYFRDDPRDTQATVLIAVNEWTPESMSPWESVVRKLKLHIGMPLSVFCIALIRADIMTGRIDERVASTAGATYLDISVEMVSMDLLRPKYFNLPREDGPDFPRLVKSWPRIQDEIISILESFSPTTGHMTAISLFELGFDECNNPRTVYVTVDYDSQASGWPPVLDAMQACVDKFGLGLRVHLEHNVFHHHAFQLLKSDLTKMERDTREDDFNYTLKNPYSTTVKAGDDISAGRYIRRSDGKLSNPIVGTLGCWVEILVKDRGWRKMGLTCYHVVRPCLNGYTMGTKKVKTDNEQWVFRGDMGNPVQDSDLWAADYEGFGTEGTARRARVEHPARIKHNFMVEKWQASIQHYQSQGASAKALETTALLDQSIAFFDRDEQFFGKVCFASGYTRRTKTGARLDWALIAPISDNRIGGNPLPSLDDWVEKKYDPEDAPLTDEQLKPQGQSLHDCIEGDKVVHKVSVFKNGASTTCTMGYLSKIKTDCVISEEKYMSKGDSVPRRSLSSLRSREFVVKAEVRRAGRFGNRGDSGAIVWDAQGRAVGVLFTGQQPQGTEEGYCLVTPIEDVFEDIKDRSRGNILDIRIPAFGSNEHVEMNSS